ncbi:probable aldehyde oxidase gad-3 [Pieris rapae]|uniref:probable aldehyde oxidase gad-3 n=1 Tax=Pieris rapae TaxID=64459 RepID=UPI001E2813E3|nr:probable aldehyde oxidase gad-3 [Pieris rapae]
MPTIEFTINGKICRVDNTIPRHTTLNAYIRYYLGLPGTKAMCHQGVCGSCIVMVHAFRATSGKYETFSVNSCLVLALSCQGWEITTIEEIGNRRKGYDTVQKRIAKNYATQCGYCTPGFIMQLHSLLPKKLQMKELENSFGSNTCRCTGYRPILKTIKSFGSDAPEVQDIEELSICEKKCDRKCSVSSEWSVLEENDEIIEIDCGSEKFYKVWTVEHIFEVIRGPCEYRFVDGNTAQGVLPSLSDYPPVIIDISDVTSLKKYYFDQNLVLGGNISIEDCITIFKKEGKEREEFSYLLEFVKHLDVVAHIPVRKIGSVAGNFMIKHIKRHYQSDLYLLFECVGAVVTIKSEHSELTLTLKEFLNQDMKGFLIINFKLPPLSSAHVVRTYKITPRNQNALAIVNAAFNFKMNHDTLAIEDATIVYGNITETFVHAFRCEKYLQGRNMFNNGSLQSAIQILNQEIKPDKVPPELSPMTRKKIAIGVFYKFVLSICPPELYPYFYASGATNITRPLSSGKQLYPTSPDLYPVTKPVQKLEAIIQTSGEAAYVNDMPLGLNDVFAAFVLSTVHGGSVDSINYDILETPGVLALLTAKDIPGKNSFGFPGIPLQEVDEYILATDDIQFCGQPIAIIVAESEYLAVKMAEKVEVTYKNVPKTPAVITIDEAKEIKSRYKEGTADAEKIVPKGRGENVKKVIKGKYYIGAQYHYYLEPQTSIVVPVDKGFEVHSATQWIDLTQICVARCLGIKESDVLVIVRRLGGGFGGKLSRSVQMATAGAVVAKNLNRTCRFILPFSTNLASIGRRPPAQCTYEVGVDDVGKIQYLDATIIQDYGCSRNENTLSYVAGGFPNCYNTDYFKLKTAYVITDLPSNTFARGPGTLEGIACIENIMEHIAQELNLDATAVRLVNMRKDDNDIPELINELKKDSDYEERNSKIIQYNKDNRWMKKSIHIAVMLFPVIYYGNYSAIVSIYRGDGTVTVTTGGIEMGQGVNTKAAQVCAYKLGIPVDMVSVLPNYSFACANGVFSGSSIVSESVCFAIIKACDEILSRIESVRKSLSNPTWLQLIQAAADQQIDLCAEFMMNDKEPTLAGYSAFSVAICETTLDVLTGRFQIDRVDILEDAGTSTNPIVDIGQVEGAYIQGLSYHTMEHFMYNSSGRLLNDRALNYEVFLAKDIPVDFRVKLRFNSKNPKGVLGSKTVGEMGICVAYGITYALRKCINESRKESGYPAKWFDFEFPRNTESILEALDVHLNEFVLNK